MPDSGESLAALALPGLSPKPQTLSPKPQHPMEYIAGLLSVRRCLSIWSVCETSLYVFVTLYTLCLYVSLSDYPSPSRSTCLSGLLSVLVYLSRLYVCMCVRTYVRMYECMYDALQPAISEPLKPTFETETPNSSTRIFHDKSHCNPCRNSS